MERILVGIYRYFSRHKAVFYAVFILSFLVTGFFAAQIKFEEDISKVLPQDKKIEKLNYIFQNSKFADKLVVMVSLKDANAAEPDSLINFTDEFAASVQAAVPGYISTINTKVDDGMVLQLFGTINKNLPIYLTAQDYKQIDTLIQPERVKQTLARNLRTLTSPAGMALKQMIAQDPLGLSYIGLKKLQQLQYDENFELYDNYVVTRDHKNLLLFITPKYSPTNTGKNAVLLAGIDKVIDSLQTGPFKHISVSYFGSTAVSVSNALQLRHDTYFTQGVIVVFLIIFFGLYFRKKRAPVVILIPVLFGALFSLAVMYFIKGSISVIAMGTGSVVFGIAVNYSLHVFNHYRHTRNIEQVIRDLAMPLTVGSFTTIGGFLCLELVKSEMLKDLGLFAGFSLIGAALCSLIFLPHFVASAKEVKPSENELSWLDKIAAYRPEYNKYLVGAIMLLTLVFYFTAKRVGFEPDMTRMSYMTDRLTAAEAKLNSINQYALRSMYVLSEGKTLDQALRRNEKAASLIEKLKKQGTIKRASGVSSLIISDSLQQARIAQWNRYWTVEKKKAILSTTVSAGIAMGFKPQAFTLFDRLLNRAYRTVGQADISDLSKSALSDYITVKPVRASVVTLLQVEPQDKQKVYNAFDNSADITVVDKQYLTSRFVEIINQDFTSIAIMTSLLVFVVMLLTYGRIELTLVSFIPMAISWIWILGLMGIFGIQFNIINIIISALIFGLGDDYSLFIMDGLLQEYRTGKKNLSSYKSSIFLSAITTVSGLGVLIFAKHPALRSIAGISIIGIICVVVMSQILIPFFFNLLIRYRTQKRLFPWTLRGFFISVFAFTYFVTGCLLLTLLGPLFIKLAPFGRRRSKLMYHTIMAAFSRSMMYIMFNFRKRIINPSNERFEEPAVIISNHQSFLDILSLVMLTPKVILFTNNWVWNSPVFGAVVRMAGYFPVASGVEVNIGKIKKSVDEGYSVAIFPEGSRSYDGRIHRFHKGAFYLAEELQLDIVPVMLHGTGYTMNKGDFLLKDGPVTIEYLPRISPANPDFGSGYAERTKMIGKYFKQEYARLTNQVEQPAYYREKLFYNYLYKGPLLGLQLRMELAIEKNYQQVHELLPAQGRILEVGCGYGFMSFLLVHVSPARQFKGIDTDAEKIDVANHAFGKPVHNSYGVNTISMLPSTLYGAVVMLNMNPALVGMQTVIETALEMVEPGGKLLLRIADERSMMVRWLSSFVAGKASGKSGILSKILPMIAAEHHCNLYEVKSGNSASNSIFVMEKETPELTNG